MRKRNINIYVSFFNSSLSNGLIILNRPLFLYFSWAPISDLYCEAQDGRHLCTALDATLIISTLLSITIYRADILIQIDIFLLKIPLNKLVINLKKN